MKAWCLIRPQPCYRREAFAAGLQAAGYGVQFRQPDRGAPGDVLLLWNRYNSHHDLATRFEKDGGTVLVAENGYIGRGGSAPKFDVHPGGPQPHHYYAIGIGYHNDMLRVPAPGAHTEAFCSRWPALEVNLKPLRAAGEHILICPNRSFGPPERAMHPDWAERCAARLRTLTQRPIRIRRHPGNDQPKRELAEDLKGAWAVAIWSSGAGVHALVAGIPVLCEAPFWIAKHAALSKPETVASLDGDDKDAERLRRIWHGLREHAMWRMSWGQWTCDEIERGEPFRQPPAASRQPPVDS